MRDLVAGRPVVHSPGCATAKTGGPWRSDKPGAPTSRWTTSRRRPSTNTSSGSAETSFAAEMRQTFARLRERARVLVGSEVALHVLRAQRHEHGVSQQESGSSPEELAALARRYQRLDFRIVDNILDLRYLRDVLPRLRDAGYDMSLFYETKANLKRDQVRVLREPASAASSRESRA